MCRGFESIPSSSFFFSEKKELFGLVAFPFFLFIEKSVHVHAFHTITRFEAATTTFCYFHKPLFWLPTQMRLPVTITINALTVYADLKVEGMFFSRLQECGETIYFAILKVHMKLSWMMRDCCTSGEDWFGLSVRRQRTISLDRSPKDTCTQINGSAFSAMSRDCKKARVGAGQAAKQLVTLIQSSLCTVDTPMMIQ